MNVIESIQYIFSMYNRPRAFLMDDTVIGMERGVEAVKSMNITVDGYTDCNKLLYILQSQKRKKYSFGIIRENGSKYKPQILSNFIKKIDPSIKLIIYRDDSELSIV